jgi:L,D-transpeptidase-like protein
LIRIVTAVAVLAGAFALSGGSAEAAARRAAATPPLYWVSAPAAGSRLTVKAGDRTAFEIRAAAGDSHARVRLSFLGSPPARLVTKPGNPARGIVSIPASAERGFPLTFVARISGPTPLAITRTVLLSVRRGPVSLVGPRGASRWAYVLATTKVRSAPSRAARVVATLRTATSDRQPNLVLALTRAQDAAGHDWIRVRLSSLPNGRTGWVAAGSLSELRTIRTRLVVDTERLELSLFRGSRRVFAAPIGVGRGGSPTPHGTFYIREKLAGFHDPFYGPIAFGTSARSEVLTDWPGGGVIGIHGTNQPGLVPGRISHGCVRLRNPDILRLARLLPLGTPVVVR